MCLKIDSKVKIASRDITVYKCLDAPCGKGRTFSSPYRSSRYYKGLRTEKNMDLTLLKDENGNVGLYAWKKLQDAKRRSSGGYAIIKCIIPKGAYYYTGTFSRTNSVMSNKLNLKEIVVFPNKAYTGKTQLQVNKLWNTSKKKK